MQLTGTLLLDYRVGPPRCVPKNSSPVRARARGWIGCSRNLRYRLSNSKVCALGRLDDGVRSACASEGAAEMAETRRSGRSAFREADRSSPLPHVVRRCRPDGGLDVGEFSAMAADARRLAGSPFAHPGCWHLRGARVYLLPRIFLPSIHLVGIDWFEGELGRLLQRGSTKTWPLTAIVLKS